MGADLDRPILLVATRLQAQPQDKPAPRFPVGTLLRSGRDVLIELPLATTLADARRIVAAQQATGRQAFVDMFSRFSPAGQ
jgi:hypothetical protein